MISMAEPKRKNTDAAQRINRQDNQSNQIRSSRNKLNQSTSHIGTIKAIQHNQVKSISITIINSIQVCVECSDFRTYVCSDLCIYFAALEVLAGLGPNLHGVLEVMSLVLRMW